MALGIYCDNCERRLFGSGPWHDEDCENYCSHEEAMNRAWASIDTSDKD